jgi:prephenate dehydratase
VFQTRHVPGALVNVLLPFAQERINLVHIHSFYTQNGEYDFAIETECGQEEAVAHDRAVRAAEKETTRSLLFGPFPILTD